MGRKVKLISKSRDTFSVPDFLVDYRLTSWGGDVVETRRGRKPEGPGRTRPESKNKIGSGVAIAGNPKSAVLRRLCADSVQDACSKNPHLNPSKRQCSRAIGSAQIPAQNHSAGNCRKRHPVSLFAIASTRQSEVVLLLDSVTSTPSTHRLQLKLCGSEYGSCGLVFASCAAPSGR
jgi:hypothetical protein